MVFDFKDLFIFDMANNHQGNLEHGSRIIDAMGQVAREHDIRGALKFQFRELDTFIHPLYRTAKEPKHIRRFIETRLSHNDYKTLTDVVRTNKLMTIATPFDEQSVDFLDEIGIELIKVASCSANDWSLLERITESDKPIVCSTGGLNISQIDSVVDFFERKGMRFALMHCVPLYPTDIYNLQLNQIQTLCQRYPHIPIGFSTHEEPENYDAIKIAYAKGARLFERHVSVIDERFPMNSYSSNPEQIWRWIESWQNTICSCGADNRPPASEKMVSSLQSLKRGVFLRFDLPKGTRLIRDYVFFAMPLIDGMLDSGSWFEGMILDKDYKTHDPLPNVMALQSRSSVHEEIIKEVILQVKGLLNDASISIHKDSGIELSHHYGIERFREYGAVIFNTINREYCKKLVVQLPSQKHPYHFHKKKTETFQVLFGDLDLEKDGNVHLLNPGDMIHIEKGEWHKFSTRQGVVIEEVSTTHYNDDSFYEDSRIVLIPREQRKTILKNNGENVFLYEENLLR